MTADRRLSETADRCLPTDDWKCLIYLRPNALMPQLDSTEIPNRSLFRQPEVCEIARIQAYVLRSWEAEFPDLGRCEDGGRPPRLPPGGRRARSAAQAPAVRRGVDAGGCQTEDCRGAPGRGGEGRALRAWRAAGERRARADPAGRAHAARAGRHAVTAAGCGRRRTASHFSSGAWMRRDRRSSPAPQSPPRRLLRALARRSTPSRRRRRDASFGQFGM